MKRLLLFTFLLSLLNLNVSAQWPCTLDPLYEDSTFGVWPDTVVNFGPGQVGYTYYNTLQFKLPIDAGDVDSSFTGIPVDSAVLADVSGLPPGLDYYCNPTNCTWYGGDQGCALISGDPTTQGSYPITITLDGWVTVFFQAFQQVLSFSGYVIDINPAGIETILVNNETFILNQNFPNPTNGNTTIQFISGTGNNVTFTISNILGDVLVNDVINTTKGVNTIDLDISEYPDGVYLYTISNGTNKLTKRMIINR